MNVEDIREYCLKMPYSEEGFPFDNETLVFKIAGKIFLILSLEAMPLQFNVKCDPQKAIKLREMYDSVLPGYHMNKNHWNTVIIDGGIRRKIIEEWIDDSYQLVFDSLPKNVKTKFKSR